MTGSVNDAKSAEGLRLFAIPNVSWNSSVLTSSSVNGGSDAVLVQEMFAGELLCQSTGIWSRRACAQGARTRAAKQLKTEAPIVSTSCSTPTPRVAQYPPELGSEHREASGV